MAELAFILRQEDAHWIRPLCCNSLGGPRCVGLCLWSSDCQALWVLDQASVDRVVVQC